MKKILAIFACLAICLSFAGCNGEQTDAQYDTSVKTTGAITVEVTKNEIIKDTSGADAVLITVNFKNGTSKNQVFNTAVKLEATQAGAALDRAITDFSHPGENDSETKVEAGKELTIAFAYVLKDKTSPIEFVVTPKSGEDKTAKTQTITLGA